MICDGAVWIVPASHAVWVPGGTLHHIVTETEVRIRNLYVDASRRVRAEPDVLLLTPLLREVILRLVSGAEEDATAARHQRLCEVALDEIAGLPAAPLSLAGGQDPRLVRLPLHALETGDNFYFVFKRSRAHEPAISRLRQWLWQESQASLRPGENEPLRRV